MFWRILELIFALFGTPLVAERAVIECGPVSSKYGGGLTRLITKKGSKMVVLTDEQQVRLQVKFLTAAGNPARVDGAPQWSVSNPDVIDLIVDEDGLGVTARSKGTLGECQVSVQADADLDTDEERHITAAIDIQVVAAEAMTVAIEAGAPETIPASQPEG
jgi:hypothetical protein